MLVRNKRPYAVEIDLPGGQILMVEPGATAEVPDDLGASLLEQVDAWDSTTGGQPTVDPGMPRKSAGKITEIVGTADTAHVAHDGGTVSEEQSQ